MYGPELRANHESSDNRLRRTSELRRFMMFLPSTVQIVLSAPGRCCLKTRKPSGFQNLAGIVLPSRLKNGRRVCSAAVGRQRRGARGGGERPS
jgi:hypothetical protein